MTLFDFTRFLTMQVSGGSKEAASNAPPQGSQFFHFDIQILGNVAKGTEGVHLMHINLPTDIIALQRPH